MGSEEIGVLRVAAGDLKEPLLSSLIKKVLCQEEKVREVEVAQVSLNSKEAAEAWASLVEHSQVTVGNPMLGIHVKEEIGAEGWAAIRRAVEYLGLACRCTLVSERAATGAGRKEDMMAIWEVIANWSVKHNGRYGDFDRWALQVKGWSYWDDHPFPV